MLPAAPPPIVLTSAAGAQQALPGRYCVRFRVGGVCADSGFPGRFLAGATGGHTSGGLGLRVDASRPLAVVKAPPATCR